MGFTAGLYRYPKYKESLSSKDYSFISSILSYETNKWAQKNFNTAEVYGLYTLNLTEEEKATYIPPSQETIDFYIDRAKPDEFNKLCIYEDMGGWCSNGSGDIYNWFRELARAKGIESDAEGLEVELSLKDVVSFALFCNEYIDNHMPQPCVIGKAFKYIPSETEEDEDDIRVFSCDGIECQFEDDTINRIDTNGEYGYNFAAPKGYYDPWEMDAYFTGLTIALNIIKTTDFDKEIIKYSGGW